MSRNRISDFQSRPVESFSAGRLPIFQSAQAQTVPSGRQQSMVMVPMIAQQAQWQTQLYRLAYEQALADHAPPRHFSQYFSVWN